MDEADRRIWPTPPPINSINAIEHLPVPSPGDRRINPLQRGRHIRAPPTVLLGVGDAPGTPRQRAEPGHLNSHGDKRRKGATEGRSHTEDALGVRVRGWRCQDRKTQSPAEGQGFVCPEDNCKPVHFLNKTVM